MKHFLTTSLLWLFVGIFPAASQNITGTISDNAKNPLAGATVTLHRSADSSVVKLNASDNTGQYFFSGIGPGKYFITGAISGYAIGRSQIFEVGTGDVAVGIITMGKKTDVMKEVVVTAKKPMIEVKADRTIFNVEGSISAVGSDVIELLRKSPGVVVDRDDNIIMSGKNGVNIYIDGRPSPLSGTALSVYLRSIPSSALESIELISNPSAKYDAAGNAGIINIKLKKNNNFGTNGSVNSGYSYGLRAKYNTGFSVNNRNRHTNIYANYNYNHPITENKLYVMRTQGDTSFDQRSTTISRTKGHLFKGGIDYFINKKSSLGFIISGNADSRRTTLYSETPIIYAPTKKIDRWLVADNSNIVSNNSLNFNLNYKYNGTSGRDLDINADYGRYQLRSNQLQPNYYYDANRVAEISRNVYRFLAPSDIDIMSIRADYEQPFKKGRLGYGGKFSDVNSQNDFSQYNIYNTGSFYDSARSNAFSYRENINAAYVNFNREYKTFSWQIGLRIENSNIRGHSTGLTRTAIDWKRYDSVFINNYTDLFPTLSFTFSKNPDNQWGFSFGRRVDRPAYQNMNPFEVKIDEYSSYKGNTELQPQYTNTTGFFHTWHNKLNTRISYSNVKNVFARLIDTVGVSKTFLIYKNVATQKVLSFNISYNIQEKWYGLFANLNAFRSHYYADFGSGRVIDLSVTSLSVNIQQSFKLGRDYTVEMSGFYNSPSIWSGTFKSREIYGMDLFLQKQLFNQKASLRAGVSDLFRTQYWTGVSDFAGQKLTGEYRWEAQQFKINFTCRFGNTQMKAAKQRKTAADEEGKRVQSAGGLGN